MWRAKDLEKRRSEWSGAWAIYRAAKKPVALPRRVPTGEVLADTMPSWAGAQDSRWSSLSAEDRRALLEGVSRDQLLQAEDTWDRGHASAIEAAANGASANASKRREEALKRVENGKLADVVNDPARFAGHVVRFEGRVLDVDSAGAANHADAISGGDLTPVRVLAVYPVAALDPDGLFGIDVGEFEAKKAWWEECAQTKRRVVLVALISGPAKGPKQPCVGRIISAEAK